MKSTRREDEPKIIGVVYSRRVYHSRATLAIVKNGHTQMALACYSVKHVLKHLIMYNMYKSYYKRTA